MRNPRQSRKAVPNSPKGRFCLLGGACSESANGIWQSVGTRVPLRCFTGLGNADGAESLVIEVLDAVASRPREFGGHHLVALDAQEPLPLACEAVPVPLEGVRVVGQLLAMLSPCPHLDIVR